MLRSHMLLLIHRVVRVLQTNSCSALSHNPVRLHVEVHFPIFSFHASGAALHDLSCRAPTKPCFAA